METKAMVQRPLEHVVRALVWEIDNGDVWYTTDPEDANEAQANGCKVAALYSAVTVAELVAALTKARDVLAGLPHSLGFAFTHLPEIDELLNGANDQGNRTNPRSG